MTTTNTGLVNEPNDDQIKKLTELCQDLLQPIRNIIGPITVDSGFRTPAVNKAVKGSSDSQHMCGEAADLRCYDNCRLFHLIAKQFDYDQLIWEFGSNDQPDWVHVSYRKGNCRRQILKSYYLHGKKKYLDVTKVIKAHI